MARYAQVIVDVPAMQTNRPYTYELPQALQAQASGRHASDRPFW